MRIRIYILNFLRVVALALGLFSISISSFDHIIRDEIEDDHSLVQSEDKEDGHQEENEDPFYLPEYQATISSFQVVINQIADVDIKVPIITLDEKWNQRVFVFFSTSFFKTLFQHIISPNAP